ncbi:MAG: response regulator transcription factor [Planctomycetota bacterium]|nr:response regulator transcription factor [Planctomycetota bacterium]
MRILVVEDDKKIASFLAKGLKEEGFAVDTAHDGDDGFHLATTESYDAAILDVMLPGMDGFTLVQKLREKRVATPVLILSAKRSVDDRIQGLRAGGDDYMVKPFSFSEVMARIQALIRRSTQVVEPTSLSAGELTLDLLTRQARRGERNVELQPREFALLEYLMRNPGRILSKTAILEHVYDYSFDPQTNVVDVLVHRLRAKVDKGFDQQLIQTVRGAGYVLRP